MNITDEERAQVKAVLDSVGFKLFEKYLAELRDELLEKSTTLVPSDISTFFEREQDLGALDILNTVVQRFKNATLND